MFQDSIDANGGSLCDLLKCLFAWLASFCGGGDGGCGRGCN